jgi:hypothetical protein
MTIRNTTQQKQLIYIASDDRSGSTMLEYMLDNNDHMHSVGELHNLNDHIHKRGHGEEWNWRCSCGKHLDICPFWTKTFEEYESGERDKISVAETRFLPERKFRFTFLLAIMIFIIPVTKLKIRLLNYMYKDRKGMEVIENSLKIINYISSVSQKNIIVESSKLPHRLYNLLAAAHPDYSIKVIHLVRDARAVTYSKVKRAEDRGEKQNYFLSMLVWVCLNIEILNIRSCLPKNNYVRIRYEDLCRFPVETMKHICDSLQLPYDHKMTALSRVDKHQIGGSTRRFETSTEIKLDERWKNKMSLQEKLIYASIGKTLNKALES